MSKLAEARAEAKRLYEVEQLDLDVIASRMVRSADGVELLLRFAGVELRSPAQAQPVPPCAPEAPVERIQTAPPPRHASRPAPKLAPMGEVLRIKPVTARITRWSRAYVSRGVRLGYLASLFGVDAEDLAAAIGAP